MAKTAAEFLAAVGEEQNLQFLLNEISQQVMLREVDNGFGDPGPMREMNDRDLAYYNSVYGVGGYGSRGMIADHIVAHADAFNPVKDYVEEEAWDGTDHIGIFAENIKVKGGEFSDFIRPWMIGVIAKVYREQKNLLQNPVLILLGAQGAGKSSMVRWLGGGWPEHTAEMVLHLSNTNMKDSIIKAVTTVIVELAEFQATLEASTPAMLKSWITMEQASFRPPYGRTKVNRPVHASYIATANRVGAGLLNDPSGSRRYRIIEVEGIDWKYESTDHQQMWAQALSLYRQGDTYDLSPRAEDLQLHNAERMMVPDIVRETVDELYEPSNGTAWASTGTIYRALREAGLHMGTISSGAALVADAMRSLGYEVEPTSGYPVKRRMSKFGG